MAKTNHKKRQRPRPAPVRQHRVKAQRAAEQRTRRDVERWRRGT